MRFANNKILKVFTVALFIFLICQRVLPKDSDIIIQSSPKYEPTYSMLNINNISSWIRNDGQSAHSPDNNEGIFYPRGTGYVVYQDGLVWGGYVRDNHPFLPRLRVGGQTYRVGTVPGRIVSPGVPEDPNEPHVRIYRIRSNYQTVSDKVLKRDAAELFYGGDTAQVGQSDIDAVRSQYAADWYEWPTQYGAPFYDKNGNGVFEPQSGERPGLLDADQVIWFVCNNQDTGSAFLFYGSPPMGIELQVTLWGYNRPGNALHQLVFKRFRLINKSGYKIDSMFVGQWSDTDLGQYTNDLLGCDSLLDVGYVYNGEAQDAIFQSFGLPPPSFGYGLLSGPIISAPQDTAIFDFQKKPHFKNLPMTSFWYKPAGTPIPDPDLGEYKGTLQMYNLMNGYWPFSDTTRINPYLHGCGPFEGNPTKFPVNGDPVYGTGDIDGAGCNLPFGSPPYSYIQWSIYHAARRHAGSGFCTRWRNR